MMRLVINSILLIFFAGVCLADDYTTEEPFSTTEPTYPADCTLDGISIFSIPRGDAYIFNATIYDNNKYSKLVQYSLGQGVTSLSISTPNQYVTEHEWYTNTFRVKPINEKIEISQPSHTFYYNFTLSVRCDGDYYPVDALIPIHETNTYTPVFSNEIYEYALFSPYLEDLERLMELNPIVVNDNDMSNTEVIFSVEPNDYFDLQYEAIVPGSLNKNHTARLIPKNLDLNITQNLKFAIYVTDLGYPPKSSSAIISLKPFNSKFPTFKEPYYLGDYYLNDTFAMRSQPELDISGIGKNYQIEAALTTDIYDYDYYYFKADVMGNGTIAVINSLRLPELAIYKYDYLIYVLNVTYTDTSLNNYNTNGYATVLIELHT